MRANWRVQFANGKWRAENPIPGSMPRWSRRWQAGETSKDKLRGILETSAATKSAKGSDDQLIGDFYAGCMDEALAEKSGVKPVEPLLKEIDGLRDARDVQHMIAKLQRMYINVPFFLYGDSDVHEPSNVIGHFYASGLGMPDRDYYLKPDDRFKEARTNVAIRLPVASCRTRMSDCESLKGLMISSSK